MDEAWFIVIPPGPCMKQMATSEQSHSLATVFHKADATPLQLVVVTMGADHGNPTDTLCLHRFHSAG